MTEDRPAASPEAFETDDLSRLRRVHEDLDREFLGIPEGRCRTHVPGSVPSVGERSATARGERTDPSV